MKRKILLFSILTICVATLAAGSLAYFTAEDTVHNVITSGGIDIDLLEWANEEKTEEFPSEGVTGVMPGAEITKIVEVKNTGSNEAWIRVKAVKDIHLAQGVEGDVNLGLMVLDFDTEKWTEKDGYYYYKEPLASGETTTPLFASVTFDVKMDNRYQGSTATVDVVAQAVQIANNGDTVMDAKGWPKDNQE